MILIDHIYKEIYCKHVAYVIEGWVGKAEICRLASWGSGRIAKVAVHRQNFFFLGETSVLFLNAFQ